MDTVLIKQKILTFLQSHSLGVISTIHIDGQRPESAVVAFAEKDTLELIFGTSNTSRKYKNLQKNQHVSFVIGWSSAVGTVQYEGMARELAPAESVEYAALQTRKNPESKKFVARADQRYFIVAPTWVRLLDNAGKPPATYEITF